MNHVEDIARQAYQAYGEHVEWIDAETPMPRWEELPPKYRLAWQVVALRVFHWISHRQQHLILGDGGR
jgi:hypothetical protein